jgi:hypothetical protein
MLSRVRGRRGLRLGAAPPEAIARVPKLCPNPIDSDTSCRSLVMPSAGGAEDAGRLAVRRFTSSPTNVAETAPLVLGPPLAFPREGERDPPHPRCLHSTNNPLLRACGSSTSCPQGVEYLPTPFQPEHARDPDGISIPAVARSRDASPAQRAKLASAWPQRLRRLLRSNQFAARAMFLLWIHRNSSKYYPAQVIPFGNLRVKACLPLTVA